MTTRHAITQAQTLDHIRSLGVRGSIRDGEYRVTNPQTRDTYYTTDPYDAINTAYAIARALHIDER